MWRVPPPLPWWFVFFIFAQFYFLQKILEIILVIRKKPNSYFKGTGRCPSSVYIFRITNTVFSNRITSKRLFFFWSRRNNFMLNAINEKSRAQNWVISALTTYRVKKKTKKRQRGRNYLKRSWLSLWAREAGRVLFPSSSIPRNSVVAKYFTMDVDYFNNQKTVKLKTNISPATEPRPLGQPSCCASRNCAQRPGRAEATGWEHSYPEKAAQEGWSRGSSAAEDPGQGSQPFCSLFCVAGISETWASDPCSCV